WRAARRWPSNPPKSSATCHTGRSVFAAARPAEAGCRRPCSTQRRWQPGATRPTIRDQRTSRASAMQTMPATSASAPATRDIAPHLPKHARVLEVGCASGTLLGEIARHGHSVLGCDLSERFAQSASRLHNIDAAVADWLDLEIPEATLDAILLLGTISNLPRLDESLARARRQLRPGGMLFFNFPAADSLVARLYGSRMWMFTPSVMQFMTRGGMTTALDRAGFRIASWAIDRQAPGFGKILGHAGLMRLYPLFDRLGLIDAAIPLALPIPGVYAV